MDSRHLILLTVLIAAVASRHADDNPPCTSDQTMRCAGRRTACTNQGKCACTTGVGAPGLNCFNSNYVTCSLTNDPAGSSFNGEGHAGFKLDLPCPYLVSHVRTVPAALPTATCEAKVYAIQTRVNGSFAVSGFQVNVETTYNGQTTSARFVAEGEYMTDHYHYYLSAKYTGSNWRRSGNRVPLGQLSSLWNNMDVFLVEREADHKVRNFLPICGLETFFRPIDDTKKATEQQRLPGLVLGVSDQVDTVEFLSRHTSMCLTPLPRFQGDTRPSYTVGDAAASLGLTVDHAFLYRAIQSIPEAGEVDFSAFQGSQRAACTALRGVVEDACAGAEPDTREGAFERCSFITQHKLFAKCYGGRGNSDVLSLIQLQKDCLKAHCSMNAGLCRSVANRVTNSKCAEEESVELAGFSCDAYNNV